MTDGGGLKQLIDTEVLEKPVKRRDGVIYASEAYLKTVLELEEAGIAPIRARVADHLGKSAPSTNQYIQRLEQDGLLRLEGHPRSPMLALTPEGMRRGLQAIRQHRVAECYLHRHLGLAWTEAHREACRWERIMSEEVTERFNEMLGYPRHSPYGNPIPAAGATGSTYLQECQDSQNLLEVAPHSAEPVRAELRWIGEPGQADPQLLAVLERHGVLPGVRMLVEYNWDHAHLVSDAAPQDPVTLERASCAQLFIRLV